VAAFVEDGAGLENGNGRAAVGGEVAVRAVVDSGHVGVAGEDGNAAGKTVGLDEVGDLAAVVGVALPAIVPGVGGAVPGHGGHPKDERVAGVAGGEEFLAKPRVLLRVHHAAGVGVALAP